MSAIRDFYKQMPEFIGSFAEPSALPNSREPEVVFIGRSNVGKSSLINAIFRREIAKTSRTPGRTQTLNLFRIKDKLMLVDLPGYGFAKVPEVMKRKWKASLMEYLGGRAQLRRVFLLIDSNIGLKPADEDMMELLDFAAVPYQIILTKADKSKDFAALQAGLAKISDRHAGMNRGVLATSSDTGFALEELRAEIYNIATCRR